MIRHTSLRMPRKLTPFSVGNRSTRIWRRLSVPHEWHTKTNC